MTVSSMWVERYRSLTDVRIELGRVTVVRGENATGKTNLYRALQLLSCGADGRLAASLLDEGGMPSALSAASDPPPRRGRRFAPVRMRFGVALDDVRYELALGLPNEDPGRSPFALDAEVKEEAAWLGPKRTRHGELLDRAGSTATARDADGAVVRFVTLLDRFEPAIAQLAEPARFPELYDLRERLRRWRFYHQFPTGPDAPARRPRAGVRTPVLADDGRDLAAALATVQDMGLGGALHDAVEDAFPGSSLHVVGAGGTFSLGLALPGMRRPLTGAELSDGTLRYLSLVAALLSPRPPELLVLNEPETSLHGSLIGPLARLVLAAAESSQVLLTTHDAALADALGDADGCMALELRRTGATTSVVTRTR